MNNWLFDLGNTRLKGAPLRADGSVGEVVALAHDAPDLAAELARALPARGAVAYVASVAAADLKLDLLDALTQRFERIAVARTTRSFVDPGSNPGQGLRIAYANPDKLGVDRFLAMLGALARQDGPWVLAGVGTALTIDLLDRDGIHHGGRIAPSPALMREALHARAAQLPPTGGDYTEFADDTEAALASGCVGAALALIERSLREATTRLARAPKLLLHGGGAEPLLAHLPAAEFSPRLVLEGLARWARLEAA